MTWSEKLADLKQRIASKDRVLVAYSGGVDSSLLAKIACDVLKDNALCVILDCETLARSELLQAEKQARRFGLNYMLLKCPMLSKEEFIKNPPNRCYICKKASFEALGRLAKEMRISCIADGLNLSDYDDYRPGIKACRELGIWHPFVDAGISKQDIREIARNLGLSFWNKPSSACLSSRIPYGELITVENLKMVEQAEDFLKDLGFLQLRVRAHGKLARIELSEEDLKRALDIKEQIVSKLKAIGFIFVTLDLQGFKSGSMNDMLSKSHVATMK